MKNNTPHVSESVAPMSLKLTLIGGGILVMVMLVLTVRSIIGIFRSAPPPSAAMQTNAGIVAVRPKPPAGTPLSSAADNIGAQISPKLSFAATPPLSVPDNNPAKGALPLSVPDNSQTASSSASQSAELAGPNEIAVQRKQARIASLEALQRHLEQDAPYEIRKQREKRRKAFIEAAKKELIKQAGTSGVPKEALQKLEHSNPIIY